MWTAIANGSIPIEVVSKKTIKWATINDDRFRLEWFIELTRGKNITGNIIIIYEKQRWRNKHEQID